MGVDRTNEFLAAVASLQRTDTATEEIFLGGSPPLSHHPSAAVGKGGPLSAVGGGGGVVEGPATQFSKAAAVISRGIHETTLKLERLTKLAKKQSLYEDNSAKVHELTVGIKSDLQTLDSDLKSLQQFIEDGRTRSTRHSNENNVAIVDNLKSQLASTTKSFAEVLQIRTKTLKEQHHRQKNFGDPTNFIPRSKSNRFVDDGSVPDSTAVAAQEQMVAREDTYLSSRAQQVENIEGMIHELGQMYVKLTTLIEEQGAVAVRIDENMSTTLENTERGHHELMVGLSRMSSNQWLILKVFAILITFSTFFVVFVA